MALVGFDNGLPAGDGYQSVAVIGSTGAAYADDHQNMQLLFRGGPPQALRLAEGVCQYRALIEEWVQMIATGPNLSGITWAWQDVLAVAEAARQSLASRQAIALEARGND